MATQLDLQEQEQLDALKAFWNRWGNLITWLLIVVLGAYAAWNGWNYYQRKQGTEASAMYDELDRAVQAGEVDKAARVFADLKDQYGRSSYAAMGGLAAAKLQADKDQADAAKATLEWVAAQAPDDEHRSVARLRLAGLLLDQKQHDAALKVLAEDKSDAFAALVADRRGDVLSAQGKKDEAKAAWQAAWKGMNEQVEYRRLVEAKLTAIGAAPAASAASGVAP